MVAQLLEKLSGFREIARNALLRDELAQGHHLVRQALRAMEQGFDGLVRKVPLVGQSTYSDDFGTDAGFWRSCAATAIATKSIDTTLVGSRPIRARMPIYEPSMGYRWSGPRRSRGEGADA